MTCVTACQRCRTLPFPSAHASTGARGHSARARVGVRMRGRGVVADVRIAADADPVRADADRHRSVDSVLFHAITLRLAAFRRRAAAAFLAAAVLRTEQAAARERRRQRAGRQRDLDRLRDDFVHDAPRFSFVASSGAFLGSATRPNPQFLQTPRIMHLSVSVVCCYYNENEIFFSSRLPPVHGGGKKARHFCRTPLETPENGASPALDRPASPEAAGHAALRASQRASAVRPIHGRAACQMSFAMTMLKTAPITAHRSLSAML